MEKFDVVVVGAGPAGCAAALTTAQGGMKTLLVERGSGAGTKNMYGGRVYAYPLAGLVKDFPGECPVERWVTHEGVTFLAPKGSLSVEFSTSPPSNPSRGSFTALRPKFDQWLADRAEAAGAMVITGVRVDGVFRREGRVRGIVAGKDTVEADVVVAADGVVSNLARTAGLRGDLRPEEISVGVKETIELPPRAMEERLNLGPDEGLARVYVGLASDSLRGGGFLYTNRTSLSLGLVVQAADLSLHRRPIHELMEAFRTHADVAPLLRDGKITEYSTHMIPELGTATLPRRHTDGFLVAGDAAGFLINNGYTFRGVDLAVASGRAAGAAALRARSAGDYSTRALAAYDAILREDGVLRDMRTFRRTGAYLKNPRLYRQYPELVVEIAHGAYAVQGPGGERLSRIATRAMRGRVGRLRALLDLLAGARSM